MNEDCETCRFEAMAIEYDSDDIGELDDEEGNGVATVDQFDNLLDEFLAQHPTQDHNHEAGYAYNTAGRKSAGDAEPLDRAAVIKVFSCFFDHDTIYTGHAGICCYSDCTCSIQLYQISHNDRPCLRSEPA